MLEPKFPGLKKFLKCAPNSDEIIYFFCQKVLQKPQSII